MLDAQLLCQERRQFHCRTGALGGWRGFSPPLTPHPPHRALDETLALAFSTLLGNVGIIALTYCAELSIY